VPWPGLPRVPALLVWGFSSAAAEWTVVVLRTARIATATVGIGVAAAVRRVNPREVDALLPPRGGRRAQGVVGTRRADADSIDEAMRASKR
jgi:hypothetical protein